MKKILITGAAGFIGSSLVRALVPKGYEVVGLDNLSTGRMSNLAEMLPAMQFVEGDLRDTDLLVELCNGVDVIFHEGALPSVPKSVLDPLKSHQSNVEGTLSLLLAAKQQRVRRVVYAASSSAYGESETLPKHEAMPTAPISPYAVQKLTGEHYMQSFARVYGMETVCLRYFNVFGPFQAADSPYSGVLAKFITNMLVGEPVTIFGDGSQSRDFTYIDNVVAANLLAAFTPAATVSGKVYNVACGRRHSLLETHRILCQLLDVTATPLLGPSRQGDIQHSLADISRAQADLGYEPTVDFIEGLRRTVDWYAGQTIPVTVRSSDSVVA
jgi:nucleoside-diphosphate-sugar epimerase